MYQSCGIEGCAIRNVDVEDCGLSFEYKNILVSGTKEVNRKGDNIEAPFTLQEIGVECTHSGRSRSVTTSIPFDVVRPRIVSS